MLISQVTSVGFKLPEEYEQMIQFIANNDMNEWKQYENTQYATFVKTTHNTITMKGKE